MASNNDENTLRRVELALSNAKRVSREARLVVQSLARLRDDLAADQKSQKRE